MAVPAEVEARAVVVDAYIAPYWVRPANVGVADTHEGALEPLHCKRYPDVLVANSTIFPPLETITQLLFKAVELFVPPLAIGNTADPLMPVLITGEVKVLLVRVCASAR